jgi:hypothetical protein
VFPFLHGDASKHKQSQAKVVYGYSAAGSKAARRRSDPLQWLDLSQFRQKLPHSPSLSFIFLEWGV